MSHDHLCHVVLLREADLGGALDHPPFSSVLSPLQLDCHASYSIVYLFHQDGSVVSLVNVHVQVLFDAQLHRPHPYRPCIDLLFLSPQVSVLAK